jgi:catechol-2,3-dioxygenase
MPVQRLNHAVLHVSNVERSGAFYRDTLGFSTVMSFPGAVFLRAPGSTTADLGLFQLDAPARSPQARPTVGLYHLAWEVDTLAELERLAGVLANVGALAGASDHGIIKSLYATDPDGIEFSVVWIVPADLLSESTPHGGPATRPLDISREKARYGAQTRGGAGMSAPAPVAAPD